MGPPFTDAVPFGQALLEVAPDRILWGTDWPHPNIKKHMPNDGDLVDLIPLFMPDAAVAAQGARRQPAPAVRFYGLTHELSLNSPRIGSRPCDTERARSGTRLAGTDALRVADEIAAA